MFDSFSPDKLILTFKFKIMKEYKVIELAHGSHIIAELNANVYTTTFKTRAKQMADVYKSVNSCPCVVAYNTCAPVHTTFIGTIVVEF